MSSRMTQEAHYELFPHQADLGIRGVGRTEAEAFEQAAVALTSIVMNPEKIQAREEVLIHCQAASHEQLLLDWLNALIFEAGSRGLLFGRFRVNLLDHALEGVAWGEKVNVKRQGLAVEAKGATCTELRITREANGFWVAQCVIDV